MKFLLKCMLSFFIIFNLPILSAALAEPIDANMQLTQS